MNISKSAQRESHKKGEREKKSDTDRYGERENLHGNVSSAREKEKLGREIAHRLNT